MLSSFTAAQFANVANWQGVDEEPVAGSKNLAVGGGICKLTDSYIIDVNLPTFTGIRNLFTFNVNKAPIEFCLEVIESPVTITNEQIGIQIGSAYRTLSVVNNYLYYKEDRTAQMDATSFILYARNFDTAGRLKLKVSINNSNQVLTEHFKSNKEQVEYYRNLFVNSFLTGQNKVTDISFNDNRYVDISNLGLVDGNTYIIAVEPTSENNSYTIAEASAESGSTLIEPAVCSNVILQKHINIFYFKHKAEAIYLAAYMNGSGVPLFSSFAIYEVNNNYIDSFIRNISSILPTNEGFVEQDISTGEFALVPSQVSGFIGCRVLGGSLFAASDPNSLVTDFSNKIVIDHTKRYKLRTKVGTYADGLTYYNEHGVAIGNDVFGHSSTYDVIEAELTIPDEAKYMVFATADKTIAYSVWIYENGSFVEVPSKSEVDDKFGEIDDDIAYLYDHIEGGSSAENAVTYMPTSDLYLGPDLLDITDAIYDSNYWTIENGLPKYLGGGGASTPFTFNTEWQNNKRFYFEITSSSVINFGIKVGNDEYNIYNGTNSGFGGFVGNGNKLSIIPGSTAFTIQAMSINECLQSESSQGYTTTKHVETRNVGLKGASLDLIDGKWNIQIGIPQSTMASNVNGSRSIAIGMDAMRFWKNGIQNVAIGTFALNRMVEGSYNVVVGSDCLWQAAKAACNVVIGRACFSSDGVYDEIYNNVAIGFMAMASQRSNSQNSVAVGCQANTYGVGDSVFIGYNARTSSANREITNVIAIGKEATPTKSNQCVIGNADVSEFVLGNKKLIFNQDGTVSWEVLS